MKKYAILMLLSLGMVGKINTREPEIFKDSSMQEVAGARNPRENEGGGQHDPRRRLGKKPLGDNQGSNRQGGKDQPGRTSNGLKKQPVSGGGGRENQSDGQNRGDQSNQYRVDELTGFNLGDFDLGSKYDDPNRDAEEGEGPDAETKLPRTLTEAEALKKAFAEQNKKITGWKKLEISQQKDLESSYRANPEEGFKRFKEINDTLGEMKKRTITEKNFRDNVKVLLEGGFLPLEVVEARVVSPRDEGVQMTTQEFSRVVNMSTQKVVDTLNEDVVVEKSEIVEIEAAMKHAKKKQSWIRRLLRLKPKVQKQGNKIVVTTIDAQGKENVVAPDDARAAAVVAEVADKKESGWSKVFHLLAEIGFVLGAIASGLAG